MLAARAVAGIEADQSREVFDTSSANIASTVELAIQHEDDIVVDAGGLLADPDLSQTSFVRWATAARVLERYPEMTGLRCSQLVDDADLPAFAARAVADPTGPLSAEGTFEVVPAGPRPFYCLVAAVSSARTDADALRAPTTAPNRWSAGRCSPPGTPDGARTCPIPTEGKTWLAIQTPIYASGVTPATVDARRQAVRRPGGHPAGPDSAAPPGPAGPAGHGGGAALQVGVTDVAFTSGLGSGRSRVGDDRPQQRLDRADLRHRRDHGASPMASPSSGCSAASR